MPCVLGLVVLVVGGTCWWNRRERRIGVGNVMGRRRGGYGVWGWEESEGEGWEGWN